MTVGSPGQWGKVYNSLGNRDRPIDAPASISNILGGKFQVGRAVIGGKEDSR